MQPNSLETAPFGFPYSQDYFKFEEFHFKATFLVICQLDKCLKYCKQGQLSFHVTDFFVQLVFYVVL